MEGQKPMSLKVIQPDLRLAPYIQSFWIFESDIGCKATISRIIVPTGCAKIAIPLKNSLFVKGNSIDQEHKEGRIQFIGNSDEPVVISTHEQHSGNIIVELTPQGAYRFLPFGMKAIANSIFPFDEIFGARGAALQEQMVNTEDALKKTALLQQFLIKNLTTLNHHQQIVDFTTATIIKTNGLIPIKELERRTGYSKRYLSMLFKDYIGLSAKTLASITRFQHFYKICADNPTPGFYKKELYHYYYDQAHFIKEFKRFTGYSPDRYAGVDNEYGRIFFQD